MSVRELQNVCTTNCTFISKSFYDPYIRSDVIAYVNMICTCSCLRLEKLCFQLNVPLGIQVDIKN